MGRNEAANSSGSHKIIQRQQIRTDSEWMGSMLERHATVYRGIRLLRQQGSLWRGIGRLQRAAWSVSRNAALILVLRQILPKQPCQLSSLSFFRETKSLQKTFRIQEKFQKESCNQRLQRRGMSGFPSATNLFLNMKDLRIHRTSRGKNFFKHGQSFFPFLRKNCAKRWVPSRWRMFARCLSE